MINLQDTFTAITDPLTGKLSKAVETFLESKGLEVTPTQPSQTLATKPPEAVKAAQTEEKLMSTPVTTETLGKLALFGGLAVGAYFLIN
jgi:hypothetical protein